MRYSLLDLSNVPEGGTAADAIAYSVDLARHAEGWGYHRYWLAEHHNMDGIASAATSVLIGHIAAATRSIRVGAGGIMLGNHMPLAVAEQFGTLATIHGDRIDLGLGRAPGGDMNVLRAMYRPGRDDFATDVAQLRALLGPARPGAPLRAIPGEDTQVPLWILGSSLHGAQLAAQMGLPYAFASHFAPDALEQAFANYRSRFQPSDQQPRPHAMLAINVFAAETEAEARRLRSSTQQAFANLRLGSPGKLPKPVDDIGATLGPQMAHAVNQALRITACGTRAQVREQIATLVDTHRPEEIILTGGIHDHAARLHSFRLAAEAVQSLDAIAA